ncbi:hypothetical protein ACHAWF_000633 [Thalassiosira exigua]
MNIRHLHERRANRNSQVIICFQSVGKTLSGCEGSMEQWLNANNESMFASIFITYPQTIRCPYCELREPAQARLVALAPVLLPGDLLLLRRRNLYGRERHRPRPRLRGAFPSSAALDVVDLAPGPLAPRPLGDGGPRRLVASSLPLPSLRLPRTTP